MPELTANTVQVHPYRIRDGGIEHLLLRRAADDPLCPGIWQVITGGIEPGEMSLAAARREVLEETGQAGDSWVALPNVVSFYFQPLDQIMLAPLFACALAADHPITLSVEHVEHRWLPIDEACRLLEFPSHREGAQLVESFLSNYEF